MPHRTRYRVKPRAALYAPPPRRDTLCEDTSGSARAVHGTTNGVMNLELKSIQRGDPNTGRRLGAPPPVRPAAHRLRLQTLVRLRWLAVVGQLATVMIVNFGLGFPPAARSVSRGDRRVGLAQYLPDHPLQGELEAAQPLCGSASGL